MKLAEVKHKKNDERTWWFAISKSIEPFVDVGKSVLCRTRYGNSDGVVVGLIETDKNFDKDELKKLTNNHLELKKIFAVKTKIPIDKIKIPESFIKTNPSEDKINQRIDEFNTYRKYQTIVYVDKYFCLKDGYTAYIAAKSLNQKYIEAYVATNFKKPKINRGDIDDCRFKQLSRTTKN